MTEAGWIQPYQEMIQYLEASFLFHKDRKLRVIIRRTEHRQLKISIRHAILDIPKNSSLWSAMKRTVLERYIATMGTMEAMILSVRVADLLCGSTAPYHNRSCEAKTFTRDKTYEDHKHCNQMIWHNGTRTKYVSLTRCKCDTVCDPMKSFRPVIWTGTPYILTRDDAYTVLWRSLCLRSYHLSMPWEIKQFLLLTKLGVA